MRAVTHARVDDVVGVAGFLLPGNRVDVLGSRDVANHEAVTETIVQNVRVLAVDQPPPRRRTSRWWFAR